MHVAFYVVRAYVRTVHCTLLEFELEFGVHFSMATSTATPKFPRSTREPPPLLLTMATSTATPLRIPPETPPLLEHELPGTHYPLISIISQNLSSTVSQNQGLFATSCTNQEKEHTEVLSIVVGLPQNANGIVILQMLCQVPNSPAFHHPSHVCSIQASLLNQNLCPICAI